MEIKAVKFGKDGFYFQPFVFLRRRRNCAKIEGLAKTRR